MTDRLAASTNSYHTYSLEEALAGIAAAGFKSVELTSVPGWTEHVRRDARRGDSPASRNCWRKQRSGGGQPLRALRSGQRSGVAEFRKALKIASKLGITYVTTSTGGHDASSAGSLESSATSSWPNPAAGGRGRRNRHLHLSGDARRSARHRRRSSQTADRRTSANRTSASTMTPAT